MNYIALTRRCSASIAELKGKSVQIRRGPATVCERKAHQVTEALCFGKTRRPLITSQETCLRAKHPQPYEDRNGVNQLVLFLAKAYIQPTIFRLYAEDFFVFKKQMLKGLSTICLQHSRTQLIEEEHTMKKIWQLWIATALAAILLTACGQEEHGEEHTSPETEAGQEASQFPLTIKDVTDNEITLEEAPKAIVSMIPSNTEILYALGLEEKVVGVSDYDNYPEEVATKEKIGGQEFNVEKIISLNPDLVLAHDGP